VLAPVRRSEYVYLEIAIKMGDAVRHGDEPLLTSKSGTRVRGGDDDAVFSRLRNTLDAFPAAKQNIFAGTVAYDDTPSNGAKLVDSQGQQSTSTFNDSARELNQMKPTWLRHSGSFTAQGGLQKRSAPLAPLVGRAV